MIGEILFLTYESSVLSWQMHFLHTGYLESLRLEAGIQSYDTYSKGLLARLWEKSDESVDSRTNASCWRSSALDLLTQLPPKQSNRQQLDFYNLPPWQQ